MPFSPAPHLVSDVFEVCLEVLLGTVEEPLRLEVSGTEGQEVDGRESGLLAGGDKDDDGCLWGVLADGLVDWLHHGNESRRSVVDVESLNQFTKSHSAPKTTHKCLVLYAVYVTWDTLCTFPSFSEF